MNERLLKLLPIRHGHFCFESGHHGDLWLDLDQLFLRPAALRPFVDALAERIARWRIEAVCGPLVGGAFLAQLIAATLEVEFRFTERVADANPEDRKSPDYRLAHGLHEVVRGKRVAIVDDAINAGSAIRGTLDELRLNGAKPVVVGALVVLGTTGAEFVATQGLPLESAVTLPNSLWTPDGCPLCAAGISLQIGGGAKAAEQ